MVTVPAVRRGWTADDLHLDGEGLTFIQVARGMTYDGRSVALVDLAPTMPYVASSSLLVLGHVATDAFLDLWASAGDGAPARPAVLSLADPAVSPLSDSLLLLARPGIHGTGLRYTVTVLNGVLPASSGSCVLYVNARVAEPPPGLAPAGQEAAR